MAGGHIKDITGNVYGRLTVIEYVGIEKHEAIWKCRCECGKEVNVSGHNLRRGKTKSCGCLHDDNARNLSKTNTIHGESNTRLYGIWTDMKTRCLNKNCNRYERYGARGITICDEWINSYENFANWAKNNGYSDELSIDRINNDLGYSPENCRWATSYEQANNKSTNVYVEFNGEVLTLTQLARLYDLRPSLVIKRYRNGKREHDLIAAPR